MAGWHFAIWTLVGNKMHLQTRRLPLLALLGLLPGCSQPPFQDKNHQLVATLCDEQGKYNVDKQVETDGVLIERPDLGRRNYVGFDAVFLFNETGLTYIEIPSNRYLEKNKYELGPEQIRALTSKKYIKIFLANVGGEECLRGWNGWPDEEGVLAKHNQCLAAIPTDISVSRYRATQQSLQSENVIKSIHFTIYDSETNLAISEAVNFYYTYGGGERRATDQCSNVGTKFKNDDFTVYGLIVRTLRNPTSDSFGSYFPREAQLHSKD